MRRELVMGINAVEGLLEQSPERLVRAWVRPGNRRLEGIRERLVDQGVAVEQADDRSLDRMAGKVRHQGVIAEFRPRAPIDDAALRELVDQRGDALLLLILDGVQDPHNLGACMRSATAAGADAVVVPKDRAAGLTPVARRAAAGAAERLPLAVVTNLARTLRMLGDQGVWRVGLAGESGASLFDARLDGAVALVLGSEEKGMRRLTREHCDELVSIPMPGQTESLNVSVSAGVALFSVVRTRMEA
jgi:23S rRNA (guanosine2251-2'-O)-methyltransferase